MDRLVRWAMRTGLRRGWSDGSKVWFTIGAVALGVRLLQRLAAPGKPIVISEVLEPGQALTIVHLAQADAAG